MKKVAYFILITMIFDTSYGQDLDGKWLLKQMGSGKMKKLPVQYLLNIENQNAVLYMDMVPSDNQLELKIKGNSFNLSDDKKYADFQLMDQNNLSLFVEGIINDEKGIIEMDFVRLFPTITDLTIEEIESYTYESQGSKKTKSKFEFNKEMMDLETVKKLGHQEGQKMKIEKIDSTLFLAIYVFGKKSVSLPIKEVNSKLIRIYGMPTETGEVIATRTD